MQTLFKSNLFSSSSSKMGAKSFLSGGKKLGSSIVGAAKNNIVNFARTAKAMIPQKKEEKENNFIKNYTNFFGSKKTEKILRKNLKLVRDSLVNTFEIAKLLKASIVSITKNLKGGFGKGGGLGGIFGFLSGAVGLIGLLTNPFVLGFLGIIAAGGITALLLNEDFRNKLVEIIKPIVTFIWRSELSPRINKGKLDDPLEMTSQMRQDIGDERTLSVLKGRLAQLEENKPGFFSDERIRWNSLTKGIRDEIEFLEDQGVQEGAMSGEQYEKDLAKFKKEQEMRSKIQDLKASEEISMVVKVNSGSDKVIGKALGIPPEEVTNRHRAKLRRSLMSEIDKRYDAILQYWNDNGKLPDGVSLEKGLRVLEKDIAGIKAESLGSTREEIIRNEAAKVFAAGKKPEVKSDANQNVSSPFTTENNVDTTPFNVDAVKSNLSDSSFTTSYKMAESGSIFNLQPIPTTIGDATNRSSSGGDVTSTSNGGTSGGDAVTFYSSSNPDSSYHKLNALMTFNIV